MTIDAAALTVEYENRKKYLERANERLVDLLKGLLEDFGERYDIRPESLVHGKIKSLDKLTEKALKKNTDSVESCFDEINDIVRARVICPTLDEVQNLASLLESSEVSYFGVFKKKDFIEKPSDTGYRAIHLIVDFDFDFEGGTKTQRAEVQIRTTLQEAWGHYTHGDFYKPTSQPTGILSSLMKELSDLLHYTDRQAKLLIAEVYQEQKRALAATEGSEPAA